MTKRSTKAKQNFGSLQSRPFGVTQDVVILLESLFVGAPHVRKIDTTVRGSWHKIAPVTIKRTGHQTGAEDSSENGSKTSKLLIGKDGI